MNVPVSAGSVAVLAVLSVTGKFEASINYSDRGQWVDEDPERPQEHWLTELPTVGARTVTG